MWRDPQGGESQSEAHPAFQRAKHYLFTSMIATWYYLITGHAGQGFFVTLSGAWLLFATFFGLAVNSQDKLRALCLDGPRIPTPAFQERLHAQ
jgi:hypothetical protein